MNDYVVKYFQIAAYTAATLGIIFTAISYNKNNKIKRGEWLKSLFEKFFEEGTFSEVRQVIEYEKISTFLELDVKKMATNQRNEELLVNYLNFFEFVSVLVKNNHVTRDEVIDLFEYYLAAIQKNQFIMQYISQFGFKNLYKLLNEFNK
jgi:hypothetical protein